MSNVTILQGSLSVESYFQMKFVHDPSGANQTAYYTSTWDGHPTIQPDYYLSVDDFWLKALEPISTATGVQYTHEVIRSGADAGKIKVTNAAAKNFSLTWAHSGTSSEATRVRDFMGATGDLTNTASPHTFPNRHKAGFYPALGASIIRRQSTTHRRGQGLRLSGQVPWMQHDVVSGDTGTTPIDLTLQLDCRSNWNEIYNLKTFCDEVFDEMGEPFTITHCPADSLHTQQALDDSFTVFFAQSPLEWFPEKKGQGFSDLFTVALVLEGAKVPAL